MIIKKKIFKITVAIVITVITLMILTLVGASQDQVVVLRYAMWDQNQQLAYEKIFDEFMKENKNIKVKIELTTYGDYWTKLATQIAGKNAPDVFWMMCTYIDVYKNKGGIMELTPFIERDNLDMSKYKKEFVDVFSDGDKVYGIPKDWDNVALIYNKELLEEAGFSEFPDDLEWNPIDGGTFVEFLQKLTIDKNGKHPEEAGFDPKNIVQYGINYIGRFGQITDPLSYFKSNGTNILTPDNKKLGFDNKEGRETLLFLYDLAYKYYVQPSLGEVGTITGEPLFYTKRVVMWQTGPWMLGAINRNSNFAWAVAEIPKGPTGKIVRANGLSDNIYTGTEHPEEAWKLVKYICTKKGQDILGSTGTVFPAYKDSIDTYIEYFKKQGIDVTPFVKQFNEGAALYPRFSHMAEMDEAYRRTFGLAINGEMDPNEAIDKLIKECNDIIEQK